jgi:hypothetical protein
LLKSLHYYKNRRRGNSFLGPVIFAIRVRLPGMDNLGTTQAARSGLAGGIDEAFWLKAVCQRGFRRLREAAA